ncbi:TPA: hypothetical protein DIC38_00230 [Candidatus Nomurabacteria bacterium]|nr:MAG: hypothetical protein O210_OD1C00001G0681 [Parcubacteria bacterium RAAC4_OD1_1]HCY26103.1 hypothetical protein [Candidatus Nomurabacteria bacterium]
MIILKNKGITILEIIIVISITILIASIVTLNLSDFKRARTLENATSEIISLINKSRNNTISSLNSSNYSIHFDSDKVVLFLGSTYDPNAITNEVMVLESSLEIPISLGVSLNGGGSDIVFQKITGETNNYGTINIRLKTDINTYRTININQLGVVSEN